MVERDYIMRLLQDFFAMLAKLVRLKVEEPDMTGIIILNNKSFVSCKN